MIAPRKDWTALSTLEMVEAMGGPDGFHRFQDANPWGALWAFVRWLESGHEKARKEASVHKSSHADAMKILTRLELCGLPGSDIHRRTAEQEMAAALHWDAVAAGMVQTLQSIRHWLTVYVLPQTPLGGAARGDGTAPADGRQG